MVWGGGWGLGCWGGGGGGVKLGLFLLRDIWENSTTLVQEEVRGQEPTGTLNLKEEKKRAGI